ncbi:Helix-turn-helix domain-containing protein [Pseudomonas sp. NFIX10]|nr:Helix-turn-helix domain-containing protein [Pseudomonas sp. NFIX10]SFE72755.1 Helix-turn-helix domain-containing protein [Pseudomonas sp. NFACC06-1]
MGGTDRRMMSISSNPPGSGLCALGKQWQIIVALQSLAEGQSVQRTAEALGYESVSSFITMFRKTLGTSPARYLRNTTLRQ